MRAGNFAAMKKEYPFTYPANSTGVALPSDYKESTDLLIVSPNGAVAPIPQITSEKWLGNLGFTQEPNSRRVDCNPTQDYPFGQSTPQSYWRFKWFIDQGKVAIVPGPITQSLSAVLVYYAYLPALVNDADTDFFTQKAPDAIEADAIRQLKLLVNEEAEAQLWDNEFANKYKEIWVADRFAAFPQIRRD
jgi:hypothetical protein